MATTGQNQAVEDRVQEGAVSLGESAAAPLTILQPDRHEWYPVARGYQVPFARRIRDEAQIHTGGVGLIADPQYADEIITSGQADLVFIGRELLSEPYWALKAQHTLGIDPGWPTQYGYAVWLCC